MKPAFRTADRVKIRYAEAGRGVGETVVLTSPWPESLFAFRKVWGRLAERFHVIAIDLPGFGQSDRRLDLYAPKAMGAFLVNLIKEWQLGPVHFVGPDVGTSAQLWAAAMNPDLVRSLVIGGGAMALPLQTGGALKTIIEAPNMDWVTDSAQTLGPVYDAIQAAPPEIKADYLASYAGDRFAESARYVRSYPSELPPLAKILPTIQTPVLLMSGANDELVPLVNAEFLHERLPNSRMGMLQAGHFAWEEVSDQYADGLLAWIGGGYRELTAASAGAEGKADE
jgi:pimeloyl-ACP methyl ester carboxylesterase